MSDPALSSMFLTRRQLLKVGLAGSAFLATAGLLAGLRRCAADGPARDLAILRETDLPFLHATLPVLLAGSVAEAEMSLAVTATIETMDAGVSRVSPEAQRQALLLFDVLTLPVVRGSLTGVWGRWEDADTIAIERFLQRWQNSSLRLLNMGYSALLQLVLLSWYGSPLSWTHCAYPGPPKL